MKVVQYKCPSCGADLKFNADGQNFKCDYCDSEYSDVQLADIFPEKEYHPLDISEPEKTAEEINEEEKFAEYNTFYNCPGCGAAIVTDNMTAATKCFYCHSPVILTGRLSGDAKPAKVIPFVVTRESAIEALKGYCKRHFFIKNSFKTDAALSEITSIYIPYWLSDCKVGGRISAKCKKIRTWRTSNTEYTETKEYIAVRSGDMMFDGIPADASSKADDTLTECIEPFDYSGMKDFKMSYLSGYLAEKYDVDKEAVLPRIKTRAKDSATDVMKATITGYNSVNVTENTLDLQNVKFHHTLFPVWFLSYKYRNKMYYFAINGQTGKFAGSLPASGTKLFITTMILIGTGLILGGFAGGLFPWILG